MATGCQQLITESKTDAGSAMKEASVLGPQTRDVKPTQSPLAEEDVL